MASEQKVDVEILRCRQHGCWGIAIDGVRITSGKCCGSWAIERTWRVLPSEIRDALPTGDSHDDD
jgi:hypothetical protein